MEMYFHKSIVRVTLETCLAKRYLAMDLNVKILLYNSKKFCSNDDLDAHLDAQMVASVEI
jgi:hypothetical protein